MSSYISEQDNLASFVFHVTLQQDFFNVQIIAAETLTCLTRSMPRQVKNMKPRDAGTITSHNDKI